MNNIDLIFNIYFRIQIIAIVCKLFGIINTSWYVTFAPSIIMAESTITFILMMSVYSFFKVLFTRRDVDNM